MQTALMVQIANKFTKPRNVHETQNKRCFSYIDVFAMGQNVGHQICCIKNASSLNEISWKKAAAGLG